MKTLCRNPRVIGTLECVRASLNAGHYESLKIAWQKFEIRCRTQVERGVLTPRIVPRRAPRSIAVAGH
jgi:hypothetical protein